MPGGQCTAPAPRALPPGLLRRTVVRPETGDRSRRANVQGRARTADRRIEAPSTSCSWALRPTAPGADLRRGEDGNRRDADHVRRASRVVSRARRPEHRRGVVGAPSCPPSPNRRDAQRPEQASSRAGAGADGGSSDQSTEHLVLVGATHHCARGGSPKR
jgi:hypothetical protein